jgi:hypothetical protein
MDDNFKKDNSDKEKATKEVYIDGKRLRLKKFDISLITKIAPNPSIAMIAKRGSGKSVAIKAIMYAHRDIPGGIIISRTEKMSPFFSKFFPDLFIYYKYTSETLTNLLERQEHFKEQRDEKEGIFGEKLQARLRRGKKKLDTRAWLIMDDCLAHKGTWSKDEPMQEVFMDGRHFDLFFILTMQYPLGIGPDLRTNFDFIFLFGENFTNIQRKVHEHYAGMFPTFESFKKVFRACTVNFGCMVINNRTKSDNIEDMVYWWRAPDLDIKKYVGHKSFIKRHHDYYDPSCRRRAKKMPDIGELCGKRRNMCDFKVDLIE